MIINAPGSDPVAIPREAASFDVEMTTFNQLPIFDFKEASFHLGTSVLTSALAGLQLGAATSFWLAVSVIQIRSGAVETL